MSRLFLFRTGLVASLLVAAAPGHGRAQVPSAPSPEQQPTDQPPTEQPQPDEQPPADEPAREPVRQGRDGRDGRDPSRGPGEGVVGRAGDARQSRAAGPTRQEVTFTSTLLGGYDDNLTAGMGTGAGAVPTAMASGSTASLDATLNYFRGNQLRSFSLDTTGNLMAYPDYFDQPIAGGAATAEARTAMGRANTLTVSERAGYEPLVNLLSPGGNGAMLPPDLAAPSPTTGLYDRKSVSANSRVSLETRWGRRDTTTVAYAYNLRDFVDDDEGDNTGHTVDTTYRRSVGKGLKGRADYRYTNLEYLALDGLSRPTLTHRIEGGVDVDHVLSRRGRKLRWSVAAGAGHIETISSATSLPYQTWTPMGSAAMTLAFSPRWSLDGMYRRDFTLLQGVTSEVYATDSVTVTTGGYLTRRTQMSVGATYGNSKTPVASGVTDTFNVYGGLLQVRQFLTETLALMASYNYYHHVYSNPDALPQGFPPDYDRNAVRFGITVRVPLIGAPRSQSPNAR